MKFRTLALVLALGFGLTMGAEAKKKPATYHAKSRVTKVRKFKKHKVKYPKHTNTRIARR